MNLVRKLPNAPAKGRSPDVENTRFLHHHDLDKAHILHPVGQVAEGSPVGEAGRRDESLLPKRRVMAAHLGEKRKRARKVYEVAQVHGPHALGAAADLVHAHEPGQIGES
jgi:hypothetical protein